MLLFEEAVFKAKQAGLVKTGTQLSLPQAYLGVVGKTDMIHVVEAGIKGSCYQSIKQGMQKP